MTALPDPGTPITHRWRKWDGAPHWEHDCLFLGADEHGAWLGQDVGFRSERPGRLVAVPHRTVTLIPHDTRHAVTLLADPEAFEVYIDVAWDVEWADDGPTGIDMDLDVIRLRADGITFIDDEDEWEEHRVQLDYPAAIVADLEAHAAALANAVRDRRAPYDAATAERWFAVLDALLRGR